MLIRRAQPSLYRCAGMAQITGTREPARLPAEDRLSELVKRRFVRQQGLADPAPASCAYLYPALMFQPRLLTGIVLVGIVLQSAPIFLVLAGILWWNVLVPRHNPFDALYNRTIAGPRNLPPLGSAPAPRRFAQGIAGTILAGAGLALVAGIPALAWFLEGLMLVALAALLLGRFCIGSYLYHRLRGKAAFAKPLS